MLYRYPAFHDYISKLCRNNCRSFRFSCHYFTILIYCYLLRIGLLFSYNKVLLQHYMVIISHIILFFNRKNYHVICKN